MTVKTMIGVFDSGFGGLTVLKEFLRVLPEYDYVYLGDNARAPYGNKSDELIYNYTREAVDFLFKQGCELVIIACHTASARALRRIQQEYLPARNASRSDAGGPVHFPGKRVLGVAVPLVEEATIGIGLNKFNRIGVIGTKATIESRIYKKELEKIRKDLEIYEQACPLLAPLVEEGWTGRPETKMILRKYLRPLKEKRINTLILGCTHYPLLAKEISGVMGSRVKIINPAVAAAERLADYLKRRKEIEVKLGKNKKRIFFTTDDEKKFKEFGQKFLGSDIKEVRRVVI